jgi:hypothetical protein
VEGVGLCKCERNAPTLAWALVGWQAGLLEEVDCVSVARNSDSTALPPPLVTRSRGGARCWCTDAEMDIPEWVRACEGDFAERVGELLDEGAFAPASVWPTKGVSFWKTPLGKLFECDIRTLNGHLGIAISANALSVVQLLLKVNRLGFMATVVSVEITPCLLRILTT